MAGAARASLLLLLLQLAGGLELEAEPDLADVDVFNVTADAAPVPEPPWPPSSAASARKCCPPGLSMYRVNAPGCDNQVTCKIPDGDDSDAGEAAASSILWSLQAGAAAGEYGFPIACPRERCHLVLLGNASDDAEPYCVDKLVETDSSGQMLRKVMAGMACIKGAEFGYDLGRTADPGGAHAGRLRASSPFPGVPVVAFRKCCALHQAYDLASRTCVDRGTAAGAEAADVDADEATTTPAPGLVLPADYRRRSVSALLARVFDKNLTALVDMTIGPPDCEQQRGRQQPVEDEEERRRVYEGTALLDVAVFDLPRDAHLVDAQGVATVRPTPLRSAAEDDAAVSDDGPALRLPPGDYCVDEALDGVGLDDGALVVKACLSGAAATRAKVCRRFGCFRKCCAHHEHFAASHGCVARPGGAEPLRPQMHDPPPPFSLNISEGYKEQTAAELVAEAFGRYQRDQQPQQVTFSSVVDNVCPDNRYLLDETDDWFMDRFGTLYHTGWREIASTVYCMDGQQLDDDDPAANLSLAVLGCFPDEPQKLEEGGRLMAIAVGLLISCMFLAATLATYCCLPALQNLHGKTLMCHVSCLLVAYLCLAMTQLFTWRFAEKDDYLCSIIGYVVLFTFLSAFSWLNVMCFDIWRTFGGMTSSRAVKRSSASRRFRWYNAYAWGLSSAISAACVAVDQWPGSDKSVFRPQMGDGSCWFRTESTGPIYEKSYGLLIFFVGPLTVQTCSNLVLFVLTVRNYSRIKTEINRLHQAPNSTKVRKFEADSNKLKMNAKLFVVMGVTWVLEIVSTFFPHEHAVFYLSDAANALQGVMIFAIFVLKRKVMRALAVRLGRAPPPPTYSANPSIQTDCRLHLAVRGKAASTNTLYTSDFRNSSTPRNGAEL